MTGCYYLIVGGLVQTRPDRSSASAEPHPADIKEDHHLLINYGRGVLVTDGVSTLRHSHRQSLKY